MKTLSLLSLICLLFLGCTESNYSKEQRIKELGQYQPKDEFMTMFMAFLKKGNRLKRVVEYENLLLDREELADIDETSYRNYLSSIANNDQRCLPKEIKDALFHNFFSNTNEYKNYQLLVDTGKMPKTKEYIFLSYLLQAGAPDITEALEVALTNNELTEDKKMFYLTCTAPFQVCE